MSDSDASPDGTRDDSDETPLEAPACTITKFKQALSDLATAIKEPADPSMPAMPYDPVLAYVSRLAAILQYLAADPNDADALSALEDLRLDMGETVRALHRHGLH